MAQHGGVRAGEGDGAAASDGFGTRLQRIIAERGGLCVGIDPHSYLLADWALPDDASGARELGLAVVEAAARGGAGIVKPQVAFFERFGSAGYAALEEVLAAARAAGLLVIADVKRGDLGTSVEAYGEAWLTPGAPLEADAMTISAFQGVGSLAGPIRLAAESGKGLFVLAATSNPEAAAIQTSVAPDSGRSVARAIIEDVTVQNQAIGHVAGPLGVVLGATLDLSVFGIDVSSAPTPELPVLAPGFGHQGARIEDAASIYGEYARMLVVSESRGILSAGPDGLADTIATRAAEVRTALA
ncbi:orotidine-5'-phosphate decarboxylase [Planctomonas sp. JC2975]|uniref:orotidine-5'-phosphate decarboxylase n=1 Tax=Planctomonas sp. JC2975 TaxID=2729626 RepID=UPI001475E7D5|nr:orotidine-5'-phosphate decarboxylase [Planctomonas sp. JC2975]NNC10582.1 orotidine-5'-phosphate decarboxylase [Planctomonas sp. JC2975]